MNYKIDRAVCINLDRRTDRWAECQPEFAKLWLPVQRYSAISQPNPNKGLCLSTANVIEQAKNDGLSNVLVLEDDIEFIGLENLVDPPADFDLYYWGYVHHSVSTIKVVDRWLQLTSACCGTHAVIYAAHVFQEVIDGLRATSDTIDGHLWKTFQHRGKVYCTNPMVAVQRNSHSDLSDEAYRHFMRDCIVNQYSAFAVNQGARPLSA